jgi:ATP-dependent Clp protease ATP-binding subunit ClpX
MSDLKCSFCNKSRSSVKKLIEGPDKGADTPYICDECITLSFGLIAGNATTVDDTVVAVRKTPEEIKEYLDTYVVGQDDAKETLAVALYNHYKRISNPVVDETELQKANVMMMGPSGCGKTLVASTIAKLLDIPFVTADATTLTEAGYVGGNIESIFERLLKVAGNDINKAQKGIVFIDEIDKKTKKVDGVGAKDVSGEGVQQALLRAVDGDKVQIQKPGSHREETIDFNTKDVLFIVGGAFVGLEEIIRKRLSLGTSIGFSAKVEARDKKESVLNLVESEDLHQYGFIREFIGRFPVTVTFQALDEDMMVRVLTEPKNNLIDQYKVLFKIDDVELEFDKDFVRDVAVKSIKNKTGARGLRTLMEKSLGKVQFVLPRLRKEGVINIFIDKNGTAVYTTEKQPQPQKADI